MRIPPNCEIERCVSKDHTRPELAHPYLDLSGPEPMVWACDGHRLAGVPVEIDPEDESGPVHRDLFRIARDTATGDEACNIQCGTERAEVVGRVERHAFTRVVHGSFPAVRSLIEETHPSHVRVCLNPKMLLELALAIGAYKKSPSIVLEFDVNAYNDQTGTGIRVWNAESDHGEVGVLMPMSIPDALSRTPAPPAPVAAPKPVNDEEARAA